MTDAEIIVRSSIQVFLAKKDHPKPEAFGSGCIIEYVNRKFFVSVSHVTDIENLTTFLETNQPFDERGPILMPIGEICTFDQIKITEGMSLEDFESILEKGERLDICFAEIKNQEVDLLQPAMDFGVFKVEAGLKFPVFMEDAVLPSKDERYGFYGKIMPEYQGITLKMTPTFKHSLTYHRTKDHFHIFLAPKIITNKADYEGCSGSPILDSQGRIVALACAVRTNSTMIYGFSIQECKRLLDYALQMGML